MCFCLLLEDYLEVANFKTECKMNLNVFMQKINEVKKVITDNHPYEEPIINIIPILK